MIQHGTQVCISHAISYNNKAGLGQAVFGNGFMERSYRAAEYLFLRPCSFIYHRDRRIAGISPCQQLLLELSLEEKDGQLVQLMGNFYETDVESVLTGPGKNLGLTEENIHLAGSILGTYGAKNLKKIQDDYMARHPHHIPLLFMMDVIHGMKTIFPMPLAQAASFEPEMTEKYTGRTAGLDEI